jgi:hypothetical protein
LPRLNSLPEKIGIQLDCGYRIDILVEKDKIIIENKTVKELTDIHIAPILSYVPFALKTAYCTEKYTLDK